MVLFRAVYIALFDAVYFVPKNVGMKDAFFKLQVQDRAQSAWLCFGNDGPRPRWFAIYRMKGEPRKQALPAWDRNDVEGALAEAARLLRCPPHRIQVDSR
jgi:hypothetical protein